ncbi:MAG: class I SAM-dependent methyltransferase [Deltaproteobacteria bacterium]|nr:class I SAM-dependent methyltransferase [Deltaproteobacteria bacterium]
MSESFVDLLCRGADRMGLDLDPEGLRLLQVHQEVLLKWAQRINLTTVLESKDMVDRLYLDSAVILSRLAPGVRLLDVGSGAGFPGLVLKALRPDLEVCLMEARRRRVSFLRQAVRDMGIGQGLEIRWQRLGIDPEPLPKERWPELISRATFPPQIWCETGAPMLEAGGRLWVMAGQAHGDGDDGFDPSAARLPAGLEVEEEIPYALPYCGLKRRVVSLRAFRSLP